MEVCKRCGRPIDVWHDEYAEVEFRIKDCENGRVVNDTTHNYVFCSWCKIVSIKMEDGLPLMILYEKLEKQLESSRNENRLLIEEIELMELAYNTLEDRYYKLKENRLLIEEIELMELAYNTLEDRYYKLKEVLEHLPVDIKDMLGD